MADMPEVSELRLVVTAPDYEEALRFYRDVLGLAEGAAYSSPGGRVTILEAGRATLELADPSHAEYEREDYQAPALLEMRILVNSVSGQPAEPTATVADPDRRA